MERVRRRPETILLLDNRWSYLEDLFDMHAMRQWLGGDHKLVLKSMFTINNNDNDATSATATIKTTSAWWDRACAEGVARGSILHGLVPKPNIQAKATARLAELRQRGAKAVLAVHLRSFEHSCHERTRRAREFGVHCHHTSTQFQGKLDQCALNPLRADFLQELHGEFPEELDSKWSPSTGELGLFLSTDNQVKNTDAHFLAAFKNVVLPGLVGGISVDHPAAMLTDMWTSSLADVYMGNTMSSCDGIVAQWRRRSGNKKKNGGGLSQYPKTCFDGFANADLAAEPLCGQGAKWDDYL